MVARVAIALRVVGLFCAVAALTVAHGPGGLALGGLLLFAVGALLDHKR